MSHARDIDVMITADKASKSTLFTKLRIARHSLHARCTYPRIMDTQALKRRIYAYGLLGGVFVLAAVLSPHAQAQTKGEDRIVESPIGFASGTDRETAINFQRDAQRNRIIQPSATALAGGVGGGSGSGVGSNPSGAGTNVSATAIGNLISVVAQGTNNTIVVHATQTNAGNQNAQALVNRVQ